MKPLFKVGSQFLVYSQRAKDLSRSLVEELRTFSTPKQIPSSSCVFAPGAHTDKILFIKSGVLKLQRGQDLLLIFDEGDFVGFDHHLSFGGAGIYSDFSISVDEFNIKDLMSLISGKPALLEKWMELLSVESSAMATLLGITLTPETMIQPRIQNFKTGDIIIQQGSPNNEIYTLLQGSAAAYIDDIKVGDIKEDEIFGVVSALTGRKRTATVKAESNAMTMSLPAERFTELMKTKPEMVFKLLKSMAGTIDSLNGKILSKK